MEKKKIFLIGDSIRMGYDKYVKEALAEVAEVYYPDENCRYAENVLRFAHEWKSKTGAPDDVDLVHWNAGLWDVLELFGDEPLSTPEYYANVIPRIDRRLRMLFPKAKIVFATSTAVNEGMASPDFFRHNSNIEKYNAIAVSVLKNTDTVINDLYSLSASLPAEAHSDFVHYYTDLGTEMIGGRVLSVICELLGIEAKDVKLDGFTPEKYSKENIGF
jgi:hypothetical protein